VNEQTGLRSSREAIVDSRMNQLKRALKLLKVSDVQIVKVIREG
jgi:hypothetical protein